MTTYTATVTRDGDTWLADVPEVPGAHTFARSLTSLVKSVREVIILMDDLADDAVVDVTLAFAVDDPTLREADEVGQRRQRLAAEERELRRSVNDIAARLGAEGYSVRDTAVLLKMTPGRVSQLAN